MDSIRQPIGDLPPEVYWRRRMLALAILVLAIVVLYYLVKGAFSGGGPDASPNPSASPSVSVTTSVSPGASTAASLGGQPTCGTADLLISLAPTSRYFSDLDAPTFQATVTHKGLSDCVLDPKDPDTQLLITSGSDRIWSNLDCAETVLGGNPLLLSPDETITLVAEWPRIRSNVSCQTGLPKPQPGTYHAILTLHGVDSTDAVFSLSE